MARKFLRPEVLHSTSQLMLLAALLLAAPSGCKSDNDPYRPLTADEGATLLRDIRKDPSRKQDLTPAERAYLIRTLKK